tara:strand:+ start:289 stop:825 length:537 start_codon:yes stop_codon:yes gene_type:complete
MILKRTETRLERYYKKSKLAKSFPIDLVAINFMFDENLGYLVRTAACFGARSLNVIGSIPSRKKLKKYSGSLVDFVNINQFKNPRDFLLFCRKNKIKLVCAEIANRAVSLEDYKFDFSQRICIVVGNEESGVPPELLEEGDIIYVPMRSTGYCLNTSQTANIVMYEAIKQYENIEYEQ